MKAMLHGALLMGVLLAACNAARGEALDRVQTAARKMPEGRAYLACAQKTWEKLASARPLYSKAEGQKMVYAIAVQCERQWDRLAGVQETFAYAVRQAFEDDHVHRFER